MLLKLMKQKLTNNLITKSTIVKQETILADKPNYNFTDTVYTDIVELSYNKDKSLLYIKILEDVSISVEKAKKLSDSIHKITNGQKHFALVDATNYFFIEDDALKYMAMPQECISKRGSAYYSMNLANRLTMHFFKVFHKPSYPMELFKKKEEAMDWLQLIQ